jgi:16S rRNA processing protein RimM
MDVHTDFPERLKTGRKLWIGERRVPAKLASVRPLQGGLLVSLQGIDTPEIAGRYRNQWVYVDRSTVPPLPPGQLYKHQLVGMSVIDEAGNSLGKIGEIVETGANDVYVVRQESGAELLLPAIPSVILEIDAQGGTVRVHLLDGLVESPARRRADQHT